MTGFEVTQWVMTSVIGLGLVVTWIRNGRSNRDKFTELRTDFRGARDDIREIKMDTKASRAEIGEIKNHCAGVSSGFAERLSGHDRELSEVKKRIEGFKP